MFWFFFCIFGSVSAIEKGLQRVRFGEKVGSSKNDPKSVAICPGVHISHLE